MLQEDLTVRFESSEKMNQNPAQYENPAELLATPKPSPEKKVAGNAYEDLFGTHLDLSTCTEYPPSSALSSKQCLALTDKQCRRIQELVDPDGIRNQKDWETKLQPQLIRLYMTGKSFPLIEFEIEKLSRLSWI